MSVEAIKKQSACQMGSQLAQLFKAAGDSLRLEVLRALSADSFGVLELCFAFGVKQSGMSHHLKVLAKTGLVTTRREGNTIFYRRNHVQPNDIFAEIKLALFESANQLPLSEEVERRIQHIYRDRAKASQQFFNERTQEFKEQQDLIASFDVYKEQVTQLLDSSPLSCWEKALEIGPGAGEFLPSLAARFESVTALDLSASMLQKSQTLCRQKQLTNIKFICDDTGYCTNIKEQFDCVVTNMVLHHTPSPNQIFADASQALKVNGVLLICELTNHNQDWVKDACGDLWLGFEPSDLSQWARENNFREGQGVFFALRNGFQIHIKQFFKRDVGDS